MTLTTQCH